MCSTHKHTYENTLININIHLLFCRLFVRIFVNHLVTCVAVTAARREFARINNLTSELELRRVGVERIGVDLSRSLLALREKIQVARAQANSVRTQS